MYEIEWILLWMGKYQVEIDTKVSKLLYIKPNWL